MTAGPTAPDGPPPGRRWSTLAVVLAGTFMILLDTTIVNVAIPSIQMHLHASYGAVEWVVSGYALAYGLVLIPAGRIGDRFGHRRLFLLSLAGFTLTSLLCGTSSNPQELVAWRVVQGAMAGVLNPQILAVIQVCFAPRERGRAFAFYGATTGIATALGPLLGGILVTADIAGTSWRPIFLLNTPIGLAAIVAAAMLLPASRGRVGGLDPTGVFLVALALLLVIYPLVDGRQAGWPPWSFAALAAAVPALGAFAWWERRRRRRFRSPLVDVRLFANRAFAAGTGVALSYFAGFTSMFFSLSLWLQLGLGRSALAAGVTILPFAVGSLVGATASDRAARRLGRRVLHLGTAMVVVGLAATVLAIHAGGTAVPGPLLAPSLLFAGLGSGLTIAPNTDAVLAGVAVRDAGAAGGVLSTGQRVGTALGIAVVGVLLFGSLANGAPGAAASVYPRLRHEFDSAGVTGTTQAGELRSFTHCFVARARSADPSTPAPHCTQAGTAAGQPAAATDHHRVPADVRSALAEGARLALARDFTRAIQVATVFNMAAVALAWLLVFRYRRGLTRGEATDPAGRSDAG